MLRKGLITAIYHLLALAAILAVVGSVDSIATHGLTGVKGAKVYYDGVNGSRHLWNRANKRHRVAYHTVSGFNRFYNALFEEGFDVHVETYDKFNRRILNDYDVFFVGEQTYHAKYMTEQERSDLLAWVKDGGGLFTLVEHTDAHYMAETFEAIYKDLPLKVRRDGICDMNQSKPISPSWVDLTSKEDHPTTKGVREYRFYNGASLDTKHGVLFSMKSSWSDRYNADDRPIQNGNKRRDPGELSGPLAGGAAFEYGAGRVVVIGDHNAMSNPTMYWGDHYRFVMNSMKWLAGDRFNLDALGIAGALAIVLALFLLRRKLGGDLVFSRKTLAATVVAAALVAGGCYLSRPPVYDFFIHHGNDSTMKYMTKRASGFFSLYGQWTKEPQLRPWAHRDLKSGYDSLFLSAPSKEYNEDQLRIIDDYLSRGKTVTYLATLESLDSPAGEQLKKKFGFEVEKSDSPPVSSGRRPFNVHGPREWVESIFRFYIYRGQTGVSVKEGIEPVVYLTRGNYHIHENGWKNTRHHFDVLSTKEVGGGEFWLVMPVELFSDTYLKNLYTDSDVVRQQMAEFVIRLGKFSVGDHSQVYVN